MPRTSAALPVTHHMKDWGGNPVPCSMVRCITCGTEYAVDPGYDVTADCPFCRSPCTKVVLCPI